MNIFSCLDELFKSYGWKWTITDQDGTRIYSKNIHLHNHRTIILEDGSLVYMSETIKHLYYDDPAFLYDLEKLLND